MGDVRLEYRRRSHALVGRVQQSTASEILDSLPNLGRFYFTVTGKQPYAGTKRLKEILDRAHDIITFYMGGTSTDVALLQG